jgi:Tfp pilus assembly protein PilO
MTLVWAGCFVLFALAQVFLLTPQKNSKNQFKKQLAEKKQIYDSLVKLTQEKNQIQLKQQIEQLQTGVKDFVTDFGSLANLTFDIGQIANEKKVTSFNIKTKEDSTVSRTPNRNYIAESRLDVSFVAGFNQFAAFLNALERHQPVIFVNKFTITRSERNETGHEVSMNLSVFVRKQQDS